MGYTLSILITQIIITYNVNSNIDITVIHGLAEGRHTLSLRHLAPLWGEY